MASICIINGYETCKKLKSEKETHVLEDGWFMPVGETYEKEANMRMLVATYADLKAQMADGTFREDLYSKTCAL